DCPGRRRKGNRRVRPIQIPWAVALSRTRPSMMANSERVWNAPRHEDRPRDRSSSRWLSRAGLFDPQNLDRRRGKKNLAEGVHPVAALALRASAAMTEGLELVEALECDFELQGGSTVGARQRDQNARLEPALAGGLELLVNGVQRALPVGRCHVVGKSGEVHGFPPLSGCLARFL